MDFQNGMLIFLGDTHGFLNDFKKQKEIIERYNPRYVLCEQMNNLKLLSNKDYAAFLKNKFISDMTSFEEVKNLVLLCRDKEIKLVGIDFKNFGFDENQMRIFKSGKEPTNTEIEEINKLQERREIHQVNEIKSIVRLTKETVLVIIGSWHLRENGLIRRYFEDYLLIFPTDKKGDILLGPPEDDFIKYSEVNVCQKKFD